MPSQKRKEKQIQKLLQEASQNYLSIIKLFLRAPDLQNDLQVSPETIQPVETSDHDHPDSIPNENNREHIKIKSF